VRVAFLGPEGTWSHEALLVAAPEGFEGFGLPSIRDVILAVRDGAVDRALAPADNALEGSVGPTIDTLALEAPDVVAVGEIVHPISHALIARSAIDLDAIHSVVSHPQASAQSARFLARELPGAAVLPASSTAEAVRLLAGRDAGVAALGSRAAAERFGAVVLRDGVEDESGNTTRFLWLERGAVAARAADANRDDPPAPEDERAGAGQGALRAPGDGPGGRPHRTILLWWGDGASTPGWLVDCLACFAERSINLTRIESRPHRGIRGEFMFLVDLDGDATRAPVSDALEALRLRADHVRVLGSFPTTG